MTQAEMEPARAARRALWKIVRHAGRPGAGAERRAVVAELLGLLGQGHNAVRRETIWMLSEIGGDEAVPSLASLLSNRELREDARAALQRIPGEKSLAALKSALATVSADFRPAIAVSLRVRGQPVRGEKDLKLVPTRPTRVKPRPQAG